MAPRARHSEKLTERERAVHLLNRFSFGPRAGQVDNVLRYGVDRWFESQLDPATVSDSTLDSSLEPLESLGMEMGDLSRNYAYEGQRGSVDRKELKRLRERRRQPKKEMIASIFLRASQGNRQLQEVMCRFWRNHFNVSYTKGAKVDLLITGYERDVVQAHALGRFGNMLHASAAHPAMLVYLDNALSRRPPTAQELNEIEVRTRLRTGSSQRAEEEVEIAIQRGLNENYARELLELHTMGVDNGYKQKDVIEAANVLTGWTVDGGRRGTGSFKFRPDMHVMDKKRVLGKRIYNRKDPRTEGVEMIDMLVERKETSHFIATKLVRFLINDTPDPKLVDTIALAFRRSDGDIKTVLRALYHSKPFFARENYQAKFKTPFEFVVSTLRATNAQVTKMNTLVSWISDMGQPIYHCDPPTGWSDRAEAWLDPGVMALRWQFAAELALGRMQGVTVPESFYDSVGDQHARLWQDTLTGQVLPGGAGARTRGALARTTDKYFRKSDEPRAQELGPELLALLLGSPEFQRQ